MAQLAGVTSTLVVLDALGRAVATRDGDGYLHSQGYHAITGGVIGSTIDAPYNGAESHLTGAGLSADEGEKRRGRKGAILNKWRPRRVHVSRKQDGQPTA